MRGQKLHFMNTNTFLILWNIILQFLFGYFLHLIKVLVIRFLQFWHQHFGSVLFWVKFPFWKNYVILRTLLSPAKAQHHPDFRHNKMISLHNSRLDSTHNLQINPFKLIIMEHCGFDQDLMCSRQYNKQIKSNHAYLLPFTL